MQLNYHRYLINKLINNMEKFCTSGHLVDREVCSRCNGSVVQEVEMAPEVKEVEVKKAKSKQGLSPKTSKKVKKGL